MPMKVCTVDEIRRIDSEAAEKYGIGYDILMENAGNALYFVILKELGVHGKKFTVIAGQGNNGGDALVVARKLHSSNAAVRVFILGNPEQYRDPARRNYNIVKNMGIEVHVISEEGDLGLLRSSLQQSDGVVVGIFGTGLSREVKGVHRAVIEEVNRCGKVIFSVDIPSGIGGDDGKVYGVAVRSNYTVTFGLPKLGNMLYPGYDYCGKLYVSHISYPPELYRDIKIEINEPVQPPPRVKWGHKGTFGKLLTVAGSRNYYGAPMLSSLSFLKAGGGYSRLAAPESVIPFIASRASEVVYIPLKETDEGSISKENEGKILELSREQDIMIVG
ncbi:MAG: NAD(P)H-hydrate epimerase, partial [Thermoproteota archaeon]